MIVKEVPFWAIVGLLIVFAVNNGHFAGRVGGVDVWPVTYLMVQAVEGSATLFFLIVAGLYAAELLWRERDTHFDGIHDALPIGESSDWLSKLTAIAFVECILLSLTIVIGILMQTLAGYYHYEVWQYVKELFFITFPQILGFAMLAMFVQTMVSNKFIGHGIVIGVFVLQAVLSAWGWENTLLIPGNVPPYYVLRYEWLRPLRPVHRLGNLLLVCDLCILGRHFHGLCAAGCRGFAARTQPLGARAPARAIRSHGGVRTVGGRCRGLVLLQRATCSTNT